MKVDLSGKVSLVTGAARGIGEAIADELAVNGSRVVYADCIDATAAAAKSPVPKVGKKLSLPVFKG